MELIKKFYKFIWQYKRSFIIGSLFIIISSGLENFGSYYSKYIIDNLNLPNPDMIGLLNIIAGFVLLMLVSTVFGQWAWTITDHYIISASRDLKMATVKRIHDLDFAFHASKRSGSLISIIRRGEGAFFSFNHELNREILMIAVNFIFILIAFAGLDYRLTLIVLASVVIMLAFTKKLLKINVKARSKVNEVEDNISGIVADNMINFETVKYFSKEKFEQKRLKSTYDVLITKMWKYMLSFRYIELFTSVLIIFSYVAIFILTLNLYQAKVIGTGDIVLIITFIFRFYPQFYSLIFRLREIAKNYTDLEKYFEILDLFPDVKDPIEPKIIDNLHGEIEFKNIDFTYNNKNPVIHDFNLTVKDSESIALVGPSGAGKTTIVKLLLRFYDVTKGSISINGVDIRDLKKTYLRKAVGMVPQEPVLFNESILYNISYPNKNVTPEEVKLAAGEANLSQFIETLPEKYDTQVGERGIKLSGGQKQRLAIARVFLANTPILIFDEATSQLDSISEKLIQDSLWKIAKDKTTIIIAHRLSTVMRADRIIVMDKGKIIEEGTHKDLINKNDGLYKKLWDMQRGGLLIE
jgi:ATP-binding cassette subfamily B protein